MSGIGILNEKPLHAALKGFVAKKGDRFEAEVDGYIIDILQGRCLVEIQTGNFASIKRKMTNLSKRYPVRLVYPIAYEKWIVKLPRDDIGEPKRRKSPKRGRVTEIFKELVSFPHLLRENNFSLSILMIQMEEIQRYVGKNRWRNRGWGIEERRLIKVVEQICFEKPGDLMSLFSESLPMEFTTSELAEVMGEPLWLAQKAAYCLRHMEMITLIGKQGRRNLYKKL